MYFDRSLWRHVAQCGTATHRQLAARVAAQMDCYAAQLSTWICYATIIINMRLIYHSHRHVLSFKNSVQKSNISSFITRFDMFNGIYTQCTILPHPLFGSTWSPGARLTKNYDVTIQRYRNSHAKIENSKVLILRCIGSKFCVKILEMPFEISHEIKYSYTEKYAFYEVIKIWRFRIS